MTRRRKAAKAGSAEGFDGKIQGLIEEYHASFEALPETEQILHRHQSELSRAYEVFGKGTKTREQIARESLTRAFGPKFADRMLADQNYRKILKVDETPLKTVSAKTVSVSG